MESGWRELHELGIIIEVVKQVERIAIEQEVQMIDKLVLQIGEISPVIPKFVYAVYPAAVDGTMLEHTKLEIEKIPANGRCKNCQAIFHLIEHHGVCPECGSDEREILSGRECNIKEIVCC